jgi:hypothetical protein
MASQKYQLLCNHIWSTFESSVDVTEACLTYM